MKIEIKNRFTGLVLFAHEAEENSLEITLRMAIRARANLSGSNLSGANLSNANLSGTDLSNANLSGANLSGAKESELVIAKTRILPDEGDVIGWKKCQGGVIVKLLIKSETKRCHAFGRKCRAERATVL